MIIRRILLAIPLLIAIGYIIDCWFEILTTDSWAVWQHYSALVFVAVTIYFFFKGFTKALISTGVFLVAGTFNVFSMTLDINTTTIRISSIESLPFNLLSFGLLFLFVVLNLATMMELRSDYKESKYTKKQAALNY